MTYAFTLDASACSGCKACQEACKDKNGLPEGLLWRRVVEVSGGEWRTDGSVWESSVFAYYLTLACNHCTHPKCAGVCPTDAYSVRPDGVVLINVSKCMGCGYCAWACPYGAPQFDTTRGIMTKCDFCFDNLDAGTPPTCVTACPLRVLNFATIEGLSLTQGTRYLWQLPANEHPYPLPDFSRTEPHLAIKPHPSMVNSLDKVVSNREEIIPPQAFEYPRGLAAKRELPLVAFTLLIQMAVGMAVCGLMLASITMRTLLSIGILLALGGALSFLHLGRKRNAWRAVTHLKKSWLSREVLMAGFFGASWIGTAGWEWFHKATPSYWPMALLGAGLVYSMARVYRLRAVPSWNTWRTQATFFLTAIVLGVLGMNLFVPISGWVWIAGLALMVELVMTLTSKTVIGSLAGTLRTIFISLVILGIMLLTAFPLFSGGWMAAIVFILSLAEETTGRWQFFAERVPFPVRST